MAFSSAKIGLRVSIHLFIYLFIPLLGCWSLGLAAQTLPTGASVVSGTAQIQQSGSTLTIQQSSNQLGMNWQSFNIGKDHQVIFTQPNAQSIAFNRVLGNNRSEIFGNLRANGQVFLVNPNGILIRLGKSGRCRRTSCVHARLARSGFYWQPFSLRRRGGTQ